MFCSDIKLRPGATPALAARDHYCDAFSLPLICIWLFFSAFPETFVSIISSSSLSLPIFHSPLLLSALRLIASLRVRRSAHLSSIPRRFRTAGGGADTCAPSHVVCITFCVSVPSESHEPLLTHAPGSHQLPIRKAAKYHENFFFPLSWSPPSFFLSQSPIMPRSSCAHSAPSRNATELVTTAKCPHLFSCLCARILRVAKFEETKAVLEKCFFDSSTAIIIQSD